MGREIGGVARHWSRITYCLCGRFESFGASLASNENGWPRPVLFVWRDVLFFSPLFYCCCCACSRPFTSRFSAAFCPANFCVPRDRANCIAMHIRNFLPARHLRFILSLIKNGPFGTSSRSEKLPTNFSRIGVWESAIIRLCPNKKRRDLSVR